MIKATLKDKEVVVGILVSAFEPLTQENSINLVVKQDRKRVARMRILMAYLFEKALLFGEVFISDSKKGCVLLKYPHKEKTTLKTIWLDVQLATQCIGLERIAKVVKRQRLTQQNYPKEKHIRPMLAGVKNEADGKGIAARLFIEIKAYYKNNTLPVIIDAASEDNVKLYQKMGFKIINKDASLGFPIWFLRLN